MAELVAAQFPQWADLPVLPVAGNGWDNATFRLGEGMSVRLPRTEKYALQVDKEHRWLPFLSRSLPLPIPRPLARGAPGCGYPLPWSVYGWLEGDEESVETIVAMADFATDLADFLVALRGIDPAGGPRPGRHNSFRGGSVATYDGETRAALAAMRDSIDVSAATAVWTGALEASWDGASVWIHGDIAPTNLLVADGRLSAVIDFGSSAVGDPACDLIIAWTFLFADCRQGFRRRVGLDACHVGARPRVGPVEGACQPCPRPRVEPRCREYSCSSARMATESSGRHRRRDRRFPTGWIAIASGAVAKMRRALLVLPPHGGVRSGRLFCDCARRPTGEADRRFGSVRSCCRPGPG